MSLRILESGRHLAPVRAAANELGIPASTGGDDWEVLWSYRTPWSADALKARAATRARRRTLVNHMPGTLRIASKAHLPQLARAAGLGAAIPTSFNLPEDSAAAWRAVSTQGVRDGAGFPVWLLKSKQHRGVRALLNASAAGLNASEPAIVQRRVRPLLLRGLPHAFDIGLYVLVASVRPLRVYAYERALVRFCEAPFPRDPATFVARPSSFVINHYTPIWELPFFASALRACESSAVCALRRELSAQGHDADELWHSMQRIAGSLLRALEPHIATGLQHVRLHEREVFELFRFDFLVDETARPVLTEVNLSPNLVAAHVEDGRVKAALLRDTLRIVTRQPRAAAPDKALLGGFVPIELPPEPPTTSANMKGDL